MNATVIKALVQNEVRLRMRRWSSFFAMLGMIAFSWAVVGSPADGNTMLSVDNARVLYTSSALAIGSATLFGTLFLLVGFFLVRGRIGEDLRCGVGSVIAATPISNLAFLCGRWLGCVAYLLVLTGVFLLAIGVFHAIRGEGPLQVLTYLQTYALLLTPMVFFAVSCALLFDAIPVLMGKVGDIIFFLLWIYQIGSIAHISGSVHPPMTPAMLFDFSGMLVASHALINHIGSSHFSLGMSTFDANLAPITLPAQLWSFAAVQMRFGAMLMALVPMLPAVLLFHRYSPDRVRAARASKRRTPLEYANVLVRPLSKLVQPLFRLAAATPGRTGQVLGDVTLTLVTTPAAIAVVLLAAAWSLLCGVEDLKGLLVPLVAFWGVLVSDISTRDYSADTEALTGSAPGGVTERYLRNFATATVLGLMVMGLIALRWAGHAPMQAAALLAGIVGLSALAALLGRLTRTSRTFLGLFLFGLYISLNARDLPLVDAVGFNGVANGDSVAMYVALAIAATTIGFVYNRQQAR